MDKVYFKLKLTVAELRLRAAGPVLLTTADDTAIELLVDPKSEDVPPAFFLIIHKPYPAPGDMFAQIVSLAQNKLPGGSEAARPFPDPHIDRDGNIEEGHTVPIGLLSDRLTRFVEETFVNLEEQAERIIRVLSWRAGIATGLPRSFVRRSKAWSLDSHSWKRWPPTLGYRLRWRPSIEMSDEILHDVKALLDSGAREPLGHELYKEALAQQFENPRSAFILAVTAVEVGLKQCISALVPDAQWLVGNLPAPPVPKMLKDYLPLLPAKHTINGQVKPPPREMRTVLSAAVEKRNAQVHAGGEGPTEEELANVLSAAQDLLWLLDYYAGNAWALDSISPQTREALQRS